MDLIVRTTRKRLYLGDREYPCALGHGGARAYADKTEGDGATPLGRYPLRRVYYRSDRLAKPETTLDCIALSPDDGWCDAPGDRQYNRHVRLPYPASHERLWRDDNVYDIILELGHNDSPVVPDRGSAVFMHIAKPDYAPTEGCVALKRVPPRAVWV